MTLDDLRGLPKSLLQRLRDTAATLYANDLQAFDSCDPEEKQGLLARTEVNAQWMELVESALYERRTALRRVYNEDVLGDHP